MTDMLHTRPRRLLLEHVVKHPDGAVVRPALAGPVALNPTAVALWELCDGNTEVAEMVDAVSILFGIDHDRARTDVEAALADMAAVGVIR